MAFIERTVLFAVRIRKVRRKLKIGVTVVDLFKIDARAVRLKTNLRQKLGGKWVVYWNGGPCNVCAGICCFRADFCVPIVVGITHSHPENREVILIFHLECGQLLHG